MINPIAGLNNSLHFSVCYICYSLINGVSPEFNEKGGACNKATEFCSVEHDIQLNIFSWAEEWKINKSFTSLHVLGKALCFIILKHENGSSEVVAWKLTKTRLAVQTLSSCIGWRWWQWMYDEHPGLAHCTMAKLLLHWESFSVEEFFQSKFMCHKQRLPFDARCNVNRYICFSSSATTRSKEGGNFSYKYFASFFPLFEAFPPSICKRKRTHRLRKSQITFRLKFIFPCSASLQVSRIRFRLLIASVKRDTRRRREKHESRNVSAGQEAKIDFSLLSFPLACLTTPALRGGGSFYTQHAEFARYTRHCLHL